MSDYSFLQNIEGGWKQLKNWCLHKRSDTPSDSIEGGVWYNETSKRIGVDIGEENKELAYVGEGAVDYIGVIDTVPPILTYNNNGTITVASCNVRLYSNPDYNGLTKEYNVPSKTLTMTDGGDEIVIAHYNSGTPEYRLVNRVDINNYGNGDTAFIYRVWYAFGDFHSQSGDSLGLGLSNKVANRIANDKFYSRIGDTGLELSESTGHIVNITAANVYAGGVKIQVLPFTSSTDKFSIVYKNSSNVWQKQVATSYPNNLYNPDGQGLVTLPNNKFTAVYLYRTIGDDKECFAVIDNNYYNTVDVAVATSTKRTDIPNVVGSHCVLVGRIVYQSGSASGKVQSVWLDPFTAGGIAQHNSLLDKDGGDTLNNYYGHVKEIHNTILENFGKASGVIVSDANNYIPIEQIPVGLLGGLTPKGAWNPATNTPTLSNPPLATTRGWFYIASTSGTALGTDWASTDWCISDGTVWQKIDNTDKVSSVFGRTGNVVAANGDYNLDQVNDGTTYKRITSTEKTNYNTAYNHSQAIGNAHSVSASQIPCAATGDVSATNVQAAIAELDSEKQASIPAGTTLQYYRGDKVWATLNKAAVGLGNVDNTSDANKPISTATLTVLNDKSPLNTTLADNAGSSTLPATASGTLVSKIQALRDNVKYILANWLQLGETSATAYRGDRGKTAYDHSQLTASNPHGTTAAQISSTATGDVSATTVQGAIAELESEKLSKLDAGATYSPLGHNHSASSIPSVATGDVSATNVQGAIAELASEKITLATADAYYTRKTASYNYPGSCGASSSSSVQGWTKLCSWTAQAYAKKGASFLWTYGGRGNYLGELHVSCMIEANASILNTGSVFYTAYNNPVRTFNFKLILNGSDVELWFYDEGSTNTQIVFTLIKSYNYTPTLYYGVSGSLPSYTYGFDGVRMTSLPISHASSATDYGVGDATNYGHVKVDATATDGSTNAVSSNGVYNALAGKVDYFSTSQAKILTEIGTINWRGLFKVTSTSFYTATQLSFTLKNRFAYSEIVFNISVPNSNSNIAIRDAWQLYNGAIIPIRYEVASNVLTIYGRDLQGYEHWTIEQVSMPRQSNRFTLEYLDYTSTTQPGTTDLTNVFSTTRYNWLNGITSDVQTQLNAKAALTHAHGNLTSDGKLGATAGLPVTTGTGGVIQAVAWSTNNPKVNGTASPGTATVPSREDHVHPVDTSRAPTAHASTATTYGVSSAGNYGHAMASSAAPAMNGTASAGTDNGKFAREGHVHPSDTSRLAIGSGLSAGTQVIKRAWSATNTYTSGYIYLEY